MAAERETAVFFPLRTSVELFEERRSPPAVVRAKEAAILYDRVIFETGLLDVTISSGGASYFWHPEAALTPEIRARARLAFEPGAPVTFLMGKEPVRGVPAAEEDMRVMIHGSLNRAYIAEFHSGILDELREFSPEWVEALELGGGNLPGSDPVGRRVGELNFRDGFDKSLMPDVDKWLRDYIVKSFNRDSLLAASQGVAFNLTPMFEPMLERRGIGSDTAGAEALAFVVPNLASLPWEAIVEYREHPASEEARAMLREFDQRAANEETGDAYDYGRRVQQEVTSALFEAIADQRRGLPEELAKEAVRTGVSFIPVVGPVVEKTATLTQMGLDARRARRHWTAAIMQLREGVS
jgi:hypothetical protein